MKMKNKVLAMLISIGMVFTMIPIMGSVAYANYSEPKSGMMILSGDATDLNDQTLILKYLKNGCIEPSAILGTNFTNCRDYIWSVKKAEASATAVFLSKDGTESTEFYDLTKNDIIKITGNSGSEILLFSVTGDTFKTEIAIRVRVEDAIPSLGDDETIDLKVGEEKTIGDLSRITDEDGNSYILHEYNYQVSDYDKNIVSVTNMTAEGLPAVPDDYVTALKVTGKKPGKAVVEVTLCNNDRMPIEPDIVENNVKPTITKKYTITVLGDEHPDPDPKSPKVSGTPTAKMIAKGQTGLTISWNKIKGAAGYDIFFARCDHHGKKIVCKNVKNIKGNRTFKWTKSGLKKGTPYKAYVKAFIYKNGKKTYVKTSPVMHACTGNGTKNYTNAKSVTVKNVKKGKLSLNKGKTFKIKAKVNKINNKKKLMPKSHTATLRYMSSNKKVATVSKSGKVTAKGKGTCNIVVYAHNGVSKNIKVTVK